MQMAQELDTAEKEKPFPTLREQAARYLDETHPQYEPDNKYAFDIITALPDINHFLETFFAGDFYKRVKGPHALKTQLPETYPEIKLSKPYKTFMSAACPYDRMTGDIKQSFQNVAYNRLHVPTKPQRKTEVYPLTMDQTERALLFLQKNDDYLFAINALKLCIGAYVRGVRDFLEEDFGLKVTPQLSDANYLNGLTPAAESIYHGYQGLKNNAESFVFTHDLAMQIAATLMTKDDPFDTDSMTDAIRGLFSLQAFNSAANSSGNSQREFRQCPFKNAVITMLRTTLQPQADGTINASLSQQHGQLIIDIRNIIRDRYFQAWSPPQNTGLVKRRLWPSDWD